MGFLTRVLGIDGIKANLNPPSSVGPDWNPGDPDGLELTGFDAATETRSLPWVQPSPWSGWPQDWQTPPFTTQQGFNMQVGLQKLIDIAWACLDMSSNVVSAMPVYLLRNGQIIPPVQWMTNPDPTVYTCWQEFAKQLFWDYQLGEAFVLPMGTGSDGYPTAFRVIPPWLVTVEQKGGVRDYRLGSIDVTDKILHIRYKSTTIHPRGMGPLDIAGARQTTIGLLQRYVNNLAETGGIPEYWIGVERVLRSKSEATDLLDAWIETRAKYAGYPAVLGSGATLNQAKSMSARDLTLMELSQFSESRIAVLLGTPPFLVGLAGATGSLTYCASDDTEVLTQRGWLSCDEVTTEDSALTLDHESGMSTWQPITAVNMFDVVDEPMLSMHGRGHSSLTTLAHHWPIIDKDTGKRRWVDSDHLGAQHRIVLAAPCCDLPTEPKHSDVFVELVAWLFTEGHINMTPNRTWSTISQSKVRNPKNVAAIGHALTLLLGPARVRGDRNPERAYIRAFGDHAGWIEDLHSNNGIISFRLNHEATALFGWEAFEGDWRDKVISYDFLNSLTLSQLHLFIDTCIAADGSVSQGRGDQRVFVQQAGPRTDRFRYACTLVGISTSVYPRSGSDCVTVGVKKRATYNPTFHNASPPERVTWAGRVWCPTTATGTWYARRQDREFFTGNSNISDLFDFHDRSSLRPKVRMIMKALSGWALPRGQECELNRDDYTRLPMDKRALAYKTLYDIKVLSSEEIRDMERYLGGPATQALTGGTDISSNAPAPAPPSPTQTSSGGSSAAGSPPPSNRQAHKHANIGGISQ